MEYEEGKLRGGISSIYVRFHWEMFTTYCKAESNSLCILYGSNIFVAAV